MLAIRKTAQIAGNERAIKFLLMGHLSATHHMKHDAQMSMNV
ncbi:MAG: hypothetical protein QF473_12375 [Planctomycetota bacterium]|jgi:hypothetical protein|nr:hypothetical protein [Planctomycetota bacterium]